VRRRRKPAIASAALSAPAETILGRDIFRIPSRRMPCCYRRPADPFCEPSVASPAKSQVAIGFRRTSGNLRKPRLPVVSGILAVISFASRLAAIGRCDVDVVFPKNLRSLSDVRRSFRVSLLAATIWASQLARVCRAGHVRRDQRAPRSGRWSDFPYGSQSQHRR